MNVSANMAFPSEYRGNFVLTDNLSTACSEWTRDSGRMCMWLSRRRFKVERAIARRKQKKGEQ